MQKKIWIGVGVAAILALLGLSNYIISDHTYYCGSKGVVMECEKFSISGLRCYPELISYKGYKDCPEGWIKLRQISQFNFSANGEMYKCFGKNLYSHCETKAGKSAYFGELK